MTAEDLRKAILQQAIQGKLVPQNPNDEPASILLERIREEKARLVKEKKIKKDKNESIIYKGEDNSYYEKFADGTVKCIDDEIPFEIPESWCWSRFSNVIKLLSGRDLTPNQYNSNTIGVPYMTGASNFSNGELIINRWTPSPITISQKGDLLITCKEQLERWRITILGKYTLQGKLWLFQPIIWNCHILKFFFQH
jgi:type I restriction enzyme S subunit